MATLKAAMTSHLAPHPASLPLTLGSYAPAGYASAGYATAGYAPAGYAAAGAGGAKFSAEPSGVAERALLACARRAASVPGQARLLVLVLHLSRLPALRAYHRRIARAIMEDAAHRLTGELFALRNRDLVLVVPPVEAVQVVSIQLARLFGAGRAAPGELLSAWPASGDAMARYAQERLHDVPAPELWDGPGQGRVAPGGAGAQAWLGAASLPVLTQRLVTVAVDADDTLRPVHAGIALSAPVLRGQLAAIGQADPDPYLLRHLTAGLDVRLLRGMCQAIQGATMGQALPLTVSAGVAGVLSDEFAQLAGLMEPGWGVALPLADVCADLAGFVRARTRLRAAGAALMIEGVSHHALPLLNLACLEAGWIRLDWAQTLPGSACLLDALARLSASRVVLARADTPAAVAWGLAHGVRYFQGTHIDMLLAMARLRACPSNRLCAMRQCMERAYATGAAGRTGCQNLALLDAGAPP